MNKNISKKRKTNRGSMMCKTKATVKINSINKADSIWSKNAFF
jgi:hypothetical protein